jgi:hypothetical protein
MEWEVRQKAGSSRCWRGSVYLNACSCDADEWFVEISEDDRSVAAYHCETNCTVALVDPSGDDAAEARGQRKHASAVVGCDGGGANVSVRARRNEERHGRQDHAPARLPTRSLAPRSRCETVVTDFAHR